MKAVFIREQGDPSVLEYGDMPDPVLGTGEVMVRVRAAALNRLDLYTRAGTRGTRLAAERFPHVLGGDCAGDIVETAEDVSTLQTGQRVVVNPLLAAAPQPRMLGTHQSGSYAELVAVPAANVVPIPEDLSYEQAAALPTVFLPTWAIIVREGRLQSHETALVLSASSGVGTAAIQIVKGVVGARCIATTSTGDKVRLARELGADHVINYSVEDVAKRVRELTQGRGVDLVVDGTGTQAFAAAYGSLGRGGRYGVCGVTSGYEASIHLGQLFSKELRMFGVFMGTTDELRRIVQAAVRGQVRSVIHQALPLQEARAAHEAMERSEHFGKLVLTVA